MSDDELNPYATPESSVEPVRIEGADFDAFPRWSAWWVFLAGTVTLGLYLVYWLYSRSQVINTHYREHSIDGAFVGTAAALYALDCILSIVFIFIVGLALEPGTVDPVWEGLSDLFSVVTWVVVVTWSMKLRNRLNAICGVAPGDPRYASGVVTFVMSILYLSPVYLAYRINKVKDLA